MNIKTEYRKLSNYLFNTQEHIKNCHNKYIINTTERNNYLNLLNIYLKNININYNKISKKIHSTENNYDNIMKLYPFNNMEKFDSFESINNCLNLSKVLDGNLLKFDGKDEIIDEIIFGPFYEIKSKFLKEISKNVGFFSINDGMEMIIGDFYSKIYSKELLDDLNLYNKIFIPIGYDIIENDNEDDIYFTKKNFNNDVLIDRTANLFIRKIKETNFYIKFKGYFRNDLLNINMRTSQLCYNNIFLKKKALKNSLKKNLKDANIEEDFISIYISHLSLKDILTINTNDFSKIITKDYKEYNKLINMSFMELMKEFVKENDEELNILHMYNIIRLLLLGTNSNINVAGLLFGIAKEKSQNVDLSISDIIYKNLNYTYQVKLRKSAINIKKELERIKSLTIDDVDLKKQIIVCKNMPDNVKKYALEKILEMKSSNSEYYKQLLYVKTLLYFPWPSNNGNLFIEDFKNDSKKIDFLNNFNKKLDSKVYGHKEFKRTIEKLIGKWISNPNSGGDAIGICGPPGVGKTLVAQAIGESLGLNFVQITLGGQNDGELLLGHGYTYSNAQPGMIIKKMIEAGNSRCVMYFDELDKVSKRGDGQSDIQDILIHLTDERTNSNFQDRFFQEFTFPLDKVLFIFSYNDKSKISKVLLSRLKQIDISPYSINDKKIIANKFLVKEMSKMVCFPDNFIKIDDDMIEFIVDNYTNEEGVRGLRRKLESIFLELNIEKIYGKGVFKNKNRKNAVKLKKQAVINYLGKEKNDIEYIHDDDLVGVINGLYASNLGGGVVPIQVYFNYIGNKFMLKLTGNQGKVMRESIVSGFTTGMEFIRKDIRKQFLKDNTLGFHIHTPSGAVPKDGPSAGCAFAVAFISRVLNKKIRHDVAMTGEIDLTGKVSKIGGLKCKLLGAKKAGVKLVLVPKENSRDLEEFKKENVDIFKNNTFDVITVNNLREVLKYAIVDYDENLMA